jgi:hypothetical protein
MNETRILIDRIMRAARALPADGRRSPEQLARCVDKVCRDFARETGMDPDIECAFHEPHQQGHIPAANGWTVVFEAGPHDWAVDVSMALISCTGVTVEPYYGFDLTFYREA